MNHWDAIREKARETHERLAVLTGDDRSPVALLSAAKSSTGIESFPLPASDPLLYGAADAVLHSGCIWYNADLPGWQVLFNQAHEFSHHWLHGGDGVRSDCHIDTEATEDELGFGIQRVEGYGPHERRELEANVFAREFFLPAHLLRRYFLAERKSAAEIAALTGMPEGMVSHQLSRALLGPEPKAGETKPPAVDLDLDSSQRAAAQAPRGPILVYAGPGTGKTRALVGRVVHLLTERNVAPEHILTLTFSNKAAEEMRTRVGIAAPEVANRVWMGTFHAFGLELLRKYGTLAGVPAKPAVIDPVDAIDLLEASLGDLNLSYYQHLSEPTFYLRDIVAAISRAKDELVVPDRYLALARKMENDATDEEETERARRAIEVAQVYASYEALLTREGLLDYGDLIMKAVMILKEHPEVRDELQQQYREILVDEYQDVNTASKRLLKELAGDGEGLWVVGDGLQAIYRFRGAAPGNMREFAREYPSTTVIPLEKNYRSQKHVIAAFSEFGKSMVARTPDMFLDWEPDRRDRYGAFSYEIAADDSAEAKGIAKEIIRLNAAGVAFKDQAILSRSHTTLQRLSVALEREGVPLFYLGDLFERSEIRDLLSLVSLVSEPAGNGLLRVGNFAGYGISRDDVLTFLRWAKAGDFFFPKALEHVSEATGTSDDGRRQLELLSSHVRGQCYGTSAWQFLTHYLFNRGAFLRSLCCDTSVTGMQKRLAVYQLLQFAYHFRGHKPRSTKLDAKREFLNYVRRLELWGEERQLRQVPSWADDIDAVRMLTVHAAKGLEFRTVFVPNLGAGKFPVKGQPEFCPPPVGLTAEGADWRAEEEECLFFVALSRARDWLYLSRADRYGKQNSNPSDFLMAINSCLPRPAGAAPTWTDVEPPLVVKPAAISDPTKTYAVAELEIYDRCPHRFYVEVFLGIRGSRTDSGYLRFHQCVSATLGALRAEFRSGKRLSPEEAIVILAEQWDRRGPKDHVHAEYYRREAERMVSQVVTDMLAAETERLEVEWTVPVRNGRVVVKPDWVEVIETPTGQKVIVRRVKTGRATKSSKPDDVLALYTVGAQQAFPRAERNLQILYLMTNELRAVDLPARSLKSRLATYEDAIDGIARQHFAPAPGERMCPKCEQFFICPIALNAMA